MRQTTVWNKSRSLILLNREAGEFVVSAKELILIIVFLDQKFPVGRSDGRRQRSIGLIVHAYGFD